MLWQALLMQIKNTYQLGASRMSTLHKVGSVFLPAITLLLFFIQLSIKKLDPQLDLAMDWNFDIIFKLTNI